MAWTTIVATVSDAVLATATTAVNTAIATIETTYALSGHSAIAINLIFDGTLYIYTIVYQADVTV